MDVSGIISTAGTSHSTVASQLQDANVERFQSLLERTMAGSDEQREMNRAQIREAAEMFEAHFLQMMFREMRRTNFNEDGFFARNNAENIWTDMLDEVLADQASQTNNGMGIANMIYQQMTLRYRDVISDSE